MALSITAPNNDNPKMMKSNNPSKWKNLDLDNWGEKYLSEQEKQYGLDVLLFGNPGAGKSTILRTLSKSTVFESGISEDFLSMTKKFEEVRDPHYDIRWFDTPGLYDASNAGHKRAADEITKCLNRAREDKRYLKLIFVVRLESLRIRASDVATIRGVLQAIQPTIEPNSYIICANKTSPIEVQKLETWLGKRKFQVQLNDLFQQFTTTHICAVNRREYLECRDNTPFDDNGHRELIYKLMMDTPALNGHEITRIDEIAKMLAELQRQAVEDTSSCFSGGTQFVVKKNETVGRVNAQDVQIGDLVQVWYNGELSYKAVVSFGHRDISNATEFLQITLENGVELQITGDHLIMKQSENYTVPAKTLKVGDELLALQPDQTSRPLQAIRISKITTVIASGLYAPFTSSGTIFANNILASCYCTETISMLGIKMQVTQSMAHGAMLPLRLRAMMYGKDLKSHVKLNSDGMDSYVEYITKKLVTDHNLD